MNIQKGTTPDWMRPIIVNISIPSFIRPNPSGSIEINVLDVLVTSKMAQSKAEAKRLVEQGVIWVDNNSFMEVPVSVSVTSPLEGTTIFDRLKKIVPHEGKFLFVQDEDIICVGKTVDKAVCHRIILTFEK